jgi:2-polyprenyl-3-methyl-5-hydroxy-6-metoxy-1,4-benzoquinol methylase
MVNMQKIGTIEELILANRTAPQTLIRTPEPTPVMDQDGSVEDYNQILNTSTIANYTVILDVIYRCLPEIASGLKALDLGSGPGLLALNQVKYLNIDELKGIDLSEPMVQIANHNATEYGIGNRVEFEATDIMECLKNTKNEFYDLVTFNNTAHHLPTLELVGNVLTEIDRVTKSDGLIVISDVARLKSADIVESFLQLMGSDFLTQNIPHLYEDLKHTMNAAWLPSELVTTIPQNSERNWYHIVPQVLPYFQVIVGIDRTYPRPYLRASKDWEKTDFLDQPDKKASYQALKGLFASASQVQI